jgi:5-methylcytosine-specific restriction endonuclease McrA
MPYREYLQTPEWRATRTKHLKDIGHICQLCGANNVSLEVHHNNYNQRGEERSRDLIALCRHCHEHHHKGR